MKQKTMAMIMVFFSVLMSSCTQEEQSLAPLFESIKANKVKLLENNNFPDLLDDTLILLKSYSDSVDSGSGLLNSLMGKSSSLNEIRKYLVDSEALPLICSDLFLEDKVIDITKSQCQLDFFDICPISFSRYQQNKIKMIKNLKKILGESFNKTDCQNNINKELENE